MGGPLPYTAAPRRVMNSDTCRKPPVGTFKSISDPINSGAGKRTEAYCFTARVGCLLAFRRDPPPPVEVGRRPLGGGGGASRRGGLL